MAQIREIVSVGDQLLRQEAVHVVRFGKVLHKLLDDMMETMHVAKGVGIAAPQVGISKRVVVIDDGESQYELVNPQIVKFSGRELDTEYCLSVPGRGGKVYRATEITVEAQDRYGKPFTVEVEGLLARVFQHEIDHLDGKLFIDIMVEEVFD